MTEHDWATGADALAMLDHLFPVRGLDSVEPQSRQSRLYLIACARTAWDRLPGVCRAVVGAAERIYLGRDPDRELRDAIYPFAEALTHCRGEAECVNAVGRKLVELGLAESVAVWVEADVKPEVWSGFAHLAYFPFSRPTPHYRRVPAELHSADLVREVFGNPFVGRLPFDGEWRSETVRQLANHAHATGDFSTLPVLADALEEAGCDRDDVLDHLRGGGPHVRGCWALELALGWGEKEARAGR
jgi:hypothetical protein